MKRSRYSLITLSLYIQFFEIARNTLLNKYEASKKRVLKIVQI